MYNEARAAPARMRVKESFIYLFQKDELLQSLENISDIQECIQDAEGPAASSGMKLTAGV